MDDKQRYDSGMAKRRKVLGAAYVDKATANATPFTREFQDYITVAAPGATCGCARISTSARGASSSSAPWWRSAAGRNSACMCARRSRHRKAASRPTTSRRSCLQQAVYCERAGRQTTRNSKRERPAEPNRASRPDRCVQGSCRPTAAYLQFAMKPFVNLIGASATSTARAGRGTRAGWCRSACGRSGRSARGRQTRGRRRSRGSAGW